MDPATIGAAVKVLTAAKGALDGAALRAQVDSIRESVDAVVRHLAADVLAELYAGYAHLDAALRVRDPEIRADELRAARGVFTRLAGRPADDQILDSGSGLTSARKHSAVVPGEGMIYGRR